jgi:hypothetical protein
VATENATGQPAAPKSPFAPEGVKSGQGESIWEKAERLYAELGEIISVDEQKRELVRRLAGRCEYLEDRVREIKYYIDWAEELKAKWEGRVKP